MTKPRGNTEGGTPGVRTPRAKISAEELARFLRHLAEVYGNVRTGNPALSEALSELAAQLTRRYRPQQGMLNFSHEPSRVRRSMNWGRLKALNAREVEQFLADGHKTKLELIELASARFSIPRSRLIKLAMPDLRETIRTALLNEETLRIISQEAARAGTGRSS